MFTTAPGNGPQKVLDSLKAGPRIAYPDLILSPGDTQTADGPPMSWSDFPILGPIRTSLNFIWGRLVLSEEVATKSIAFYGCSSNVGTTFLAFHLAVFVSLSHGLRTIYIDTACDKKPSAPHPVGSTDLPGLGTFFYEDAPLRACIHKTRLPGFSILPSGGVCAGQPANRFPPVDKIKAMAGDIRANFDVAIYDCQPVLLKPIEISYAQHASNIVLVSKYAASRREVCNQCIDAFTANELEITGVILNQREYPVPMNIYNLLK